jgi:hypothetical protein
MLARYDSNNPFRSRENQLLKNLIMQVSMASAVPPDFKTFLVHFASLLDTRFDSFTTTIRLFSPHSS